MTKFVQRHWVVAVIFIACLASLLLHWPAYKPNSVLPAAIPPAPVLVKQATGVDQGVQLEWLPSQAGTHPIIAYTIERSRDGSAFAPIARVEAVSSQYIDAEGREGDAYRIIAEDEQTARALPSETLTAAPAKPGTVVQAPAPSNVLGASTALAQAGTSEEKVPMLQTFLTQAFTGLDVALTNNDTSAARSYLTLLQYYQRQALSLWPQLSAAQKQVLTQSCADHRTAFTANIHRLPEGDQFDGWLVDAGCSVMQGGGA